MVKKDRSVIRNKTYLLKMISSFYQTHLENQLAPAEFLLLNILINVLQDIKQVSIEKLATALPIPILFESRRKKIKRFLSLSTLKIENLWFPLIQDWVAQNFSPSENLYLVIDRTKWARNNLIMISVIHDSRAIPIYFSLLADLGNSNLAQQQEVFSQILPLFEQYKIVVLGDREFCSVKLANWLREQEVGFCLRLKKSEYVEVKKSFHQELNDLGLKPGVSFFLEDVKVTKTKNIQGFNVACKWKRSLRGNTTKEGWFILTSSNSLNEAIAAYKKRFGIEEMFRDFKSGGYNLEDTNVVGKRLISLILLIAFSYSQATFQGQAIKKKGIQKYLGRVKELGRLTRRHSSFYIGLSGQNWVKFKDDCWGLIQALMRINRHKLEYYLRGIRAMELVLATL